LLPTRSIAHRMPTVILSHTRWQEWAFGYDATAPQLMVKSLGGLSAQGEVAPVARVAPVVLSNVCSRLAYTTPCWTTAELPCPCDTAQCALPKYTCPMVTVWHTFCNILHCWDTVVILHNVTIIFQPPQNRVLTYFSKPTIVMYVNYGWFIDNRIHLMTVLKRVGLWCCGIRCV